MCQFLSCLRYKNWWQVWTQQKDFLDEGVRWIMASGIILRDCFALWCCRLWIVYWQPMDAWLFCSMEGLSWFSSIRRGQRSWATGNFSRKNLPHETNLLLYGRQWIKTTCMYKKNSSLKFMWTECVYALLWMYEKNIYNLICVTF